MIRYKNRNGNSGVTHYKITPYAIKIKFKNASIYTYSETKIDKNHLDRMKELAIEGEGLGTYINQHEDIKDNFDN